MHQKLVGVKDILKQTAKDLHLIVCYPLNNKTKRKLDTATARPMNYNALEEIQRIREERIT